MSENQKANLQELKQLIGQAATHTQNELNGMGQNFNVSGWLGAVALASFIGAGAWFAFITTWVPAAFLLLTVWSVIGIIASLKKVRTFGQKFGDYASQYDKSKKKLVDSAIVSIFRSSEALFQSGGIILIVSLVLMLAYALGVFGTVTANLLGPIIVGAILAFGHLKTSSVMTRYSGAGNVSSAFERAAGIRGQPLPLDPNKIAYTGAVVMSTLTLAPNVYGLYATWALERGVSYLVFGLITQVALLIFLTSYLSYVKCRAELSKSATVYSRLNSLLDDYLLRDNLDDVGYEKLKDEFLRAKQYNVAISTLGFLSVYSLILSPSYARNL